MIKISFLLCFSYSATALEQPVSDFIGLDAALKLHRESDIKKKEIKVAVHDISFFGHHIFLKGLLDKELVSPPLGLMSPHGSAVSQIIAHPKWGVNPKVKFLSLTKGIDTEDIEKATTQMIEKGIRLLNISLFLKNEDIVKSLNNFIDQGGIVIASAGNAAKRLGKDLPAHYENFKGLTVSACDLKGNLQDFSHHQDGKSIMAPGQTDLLRVDYLRYPTRVTEDPKYLMEGFRVVPHMFGMTSGATPVVTGLVSLALELKPDLTQREVNHLLHASAKYNNIGLPYINAKNFIDMVLGSSK